MNSLSFIKKSLYRLKQRYGLLVDVYNITTSAVDRDTGLRTRTLAKRRVQRVLVLDSKQWTQFEYDLSWIMAGRSFSMGGHFDSSERLFIFDQKDLLNFEIVDTGDLSYVVYNGQKYTVLETNRYDDRKAIIVKGKHTEGEPFNQILDLNVFDFVTPADEVEP